MTQAIAIGDFWSQTVLRFIHEDLMRLLRNLSDCDATFGAAPHIQKIKDNVHRLWFFDLKLATDRLLVTLSHSVIAEL